MAANHIFRLSDLVPTAAALVGILAVSAMPLYAQRQQPDIAKLKADAQNAFNIISSDKLKIQAFCEMADLAKQLDQAERVPIFICEWLGMLRVSAESVGSHGVRR
jgi:hypothetical protein